MEKKVCKIELKDGSHRYDVEIGHNLLEKSGQWIISTLAIEAKTIAIISNGKVFGLYGEAVKTSLLKSGFKVIVFLMDDGEEFKNFESFKRVLEFFGKNKFKRTDAVLALGGGVVGDLAGFAASVYLRGLAFLSIPTTLLSMIDSSVGGKTAINTSFGKNIVGTFHQPKGVLIDVETLKTLEEREVLAGFCEAIKHGAIGGYHVLNSVEKFLLESPLESFAENFEDETFLGKLTDLVFDQISLKASVVTKDEKESAKRTDSRSRKILNFGHTVGHALEKVTQYKQFKHGEAVGYGMLVAAEISTRLDILDNNSLNLLKRVVSLIGELPETNAIDVQDVLNSFAYDKKALGDGLHWILLEDIGKPKIVSSFEIPESIIIESLQEILHK